jgi:hypothetical protein
MARGWESKGVEAQIDAAEERAELSRKAKLTADEIALQRERESLELSRTRVLQDLAAAKNAKFREILKESLDFLEKKLQALGEAPPSQSRS